MICTYDWCWLPCSSCQLCCLSEYFGSSMMTLSVWRPSWARKCTGSSSSTSSLPSYSTWLWKQSGASSTSKVDWKSGFRNQNLISGMVQFLIICVPPQAYSAYPIVIINNHIEPFDQSEHNKPYLLSAGDWSRILLLAPPASGHLHHPHHHFLPSVLPLQI